jgi:protein-tyrosine-phosphatase
VSQPLTPALLAQADLVFAMTDSHYRAIYGRFGTTSAKIELLSSSGEDIPDPIGCDQQVYDECAERIAACLKERVATLEA